MSRYHQLTMLPGLLLCTLSPVALAEHSPVIALTANSHICNTEAEVARLAVNPQLQEMARALVEFKPTKYCFIMPDAAEVVLLERQAGYIKFDYKSQILYTFSHYVVETTLTANTH